MGSVVPPRPAHRFLFSLLLFIAATLPWAAARGQNPPGASGPAEQPAFVPPGFESLLEPQTTLVDIYLAGEFLTSQLATFTADEITFSEPAAIVDRIPMLLDSAAVRQAISGALPTHLEYVCQYQGQPNCGSLSPEVAGVVFDENRFRADLFVSPDLLAVRSAGHQKYLPASDGGWSWLQSLNGAYAGTRETGEEVYSLSSNSILAFRENRLQFTGNYNSEADGTVDTAVFRRDWQGMEYQLGYFRSNGGDFQFMSDSAIRGMRVASSLDTREDLRQTAGNELQVFLESRSEVSLFKDGRLISSRFYDAGNQILDTTQLPGGAYDVTISIRDSAGRVKEETRFYVKSSQLPPMDQPLYFFEAGELLDPEDQRGLPDGSNLTLLRAGYYGRITDQLGFLSGVSQVESNSSLELGLTHLGRWHDVRLGGFAGNRQRRGARLNLRARLGDVYINGNYRRVWNDDYEADDPADLFGESASQASLGITTLLPVGRIELQGRYNGRGGDAVETYTARYELPRIRLGVSEMLMGFQFSREEGLNTGLFTMEMRLNGNHLTGQIRPEYRDTSEQLGGNTWQTNAALSWNDRQLMADKDLRIDLRGQRQEQRNSYGAEVDFASQTGRLRLQGERSGDDGLRYNGNLFTSFMLNGDTAKLGGREQSQSAVLVKIDGRLRDAAFDVLVNGVPRAIAYADRTTAINLRPYETYHVELRQRGSSFVDYDQRERQITLYPGNVITLAWEVAELNVVFGRVVDQGGRPVANALIKGVAGLATTDEYGLFQAELRSDVETLEIETLSSRCRVPLPEYSVKASIGRLGDLPCVLADKPPASH